MRSKVHKRRKVPIHLQNGLPLYIDLMGDFEPDLMNNIYEMVVLEGDHGWMEIKGIRDKSSNSTMTA